jgi:hypothetical protein
MDGPNEPATHTHTERRAIDQDSKHTKTVYSQEAGKREEKKTPKQCFTKKKQVWPKKKRELNMMYLCIYGV